MDLNTLYSRQADINLSVPQTATIIGCGGTGTWTAIGLAMSGARQIILIDSDYVEPSNLNRLPYSESAVGRAKVDALADFLHSLRGSTSFYTRRFNTAINESNLDLLQGVIFCCTDNIPSQQLVYRYCKAKGLPYYRVGYDGTVLNVSRAYPLVIGDEQPMDGYTVTPSWVVPAAVAGMLGVCSALYSQVTLTDNIKYLTCEGSGVIPDQVIINRVEKMIQKRSRTLMSLLEYHDIRDCDNCNRGDCDNCDRGVCSDCDRGDCDNCDRYDRGYDSGHDEGYEAGLAEGDREGYERGFQEGHESAVDDAVEDAANAIYEWLTNNNLISPDVTLDDIAEVARGSRQ